jgi:hypothetical protein
LLICASWTLAEPQTVATSAKQEPLLPYDRLQVLENFFKAVYPGLADGLGMFQVDVIFDGVRGANINHLRFYPCLSGSGISGAAAPLPFLPFKETAPAASTKPPVPPTCGESPSPEFARFLNVSLDLTAKRRKHPITKFAASGTYIDTKLEELRKQFTGKWYPAHDEVLQALRSNKPNYGPDNKQEFLATLPLRKIRELTGCSLHPDTATFTAELTDNSLHLPPDVQWHLFGTSAGSRSIGSCSAAFEPFEGRLTLFMD